MSIIYVCYHFFDVFSQDVNECQVLKDQKQNERDQKNCERQAEQAVSGNGPADGTDDAESDDYPNCEGQFHTFITIVLSFVIFWIFIYLLLL